MEFTDVQCSNIMSNCEKKYDSRLMCDTYCFEIEGQ